MNSVVTKHHIRVLLTSVSFSIVLTAITGCAGDFTQWKKNNHKVGPDYCRPAVPCAESWIDAGAPELLGDPIDNCRWWTVFNDPILNEIIETAYACNLPLREAGYRIYEARAQLGISRANMLPQTQEAFGSLSRTQQSKAAFPANPGTPRAYNTWEAGLFSAAWEMDIWGRLRRTIESSEASLESSVEDYDAILVLLIGDVASTYMRVCTLAQKLVYNQENIETQIRSLEVARIRFENGDVSRLDVEQAESSLAATEAQRPLLSLELRQHHNALCILLGMPPEDLSAILERPPSSEDGEEDANAFLEPRLIPLAPAEVAVGVPADLIRRRPDVRRAERQVAEQSARIGIAKSDLFPSFTIHGNIEYSAAEFSDLFGTGSQAGFIAAPSFRWNILNYGRIRDNIRVQDARFHQAVLTYQESVLRANQEVEDFLVGFLLSQVQYQAEFRSVRAAKTALDLAQVQYQEGDIDFNRVFTLQVNLLQQQQRLADARLAINNNLIGVYRGLGGGWQIRLDGECRQTELLPLVEREEPISAIEQISEVKRENEPLIVPQGTLRAIPEQTADPISREEPIALPDPLVSAINSALRKVDANDD